MDPLEIARWQFGITTVYHFLFVPISIGLSFLVAGFQTAWVRTGDEKWLRLTRLYGKLFLINFAMGVVTGIVQEFQFGMNWSDYSRFVGDIFGAPLAIEGLLAFFLESTFLGLWIFGWNRLPRGVHLATIWIAAIGTVLSAYFILAANSFMQNPVGFRFNPARGRAELTDIVAVLTSDTTLAAFFHTVSGCFIVGGGLVAGVAMWHLVRRKYTDDVSVAAYRSAARAGAWTTLAAMVALFISGDVLGKVMTTHQPMKMAAAEALYRTEAPASFSILTIGSLDGRHEVWAIRLPHLLSFLATGTWNGNVQGINDLQAQYAATFGPGSYVPIIPIAYWGFRAMIGAGMLAALIALWLLWATRRNRVPRSRWLLGGAIALPLLPLAANASGWIFTEMARQPWVVYYHLRTADGVSPGVGGGEVLTSLIAFTVLYGILAVVEVKLLLKYAGGPLPDADPPERDRDPDAPPALVY